MNKSSLSKSLDWVIQSGLQPKVVQSGKPVVGLPPTLRTSLSQITTLRSSLLEEVLLLKAANYDAIGLWRPKVAEFGAELGAELIRDTGLAVSSLSFIGGFTGVNGLSYEEALADGRDAILDAELLGAENVIAVSGSRNGHTTRHSRRLVVDAMAELADFAGARGVTISLLPMHQYFSNTWTYLNTLDETLEMLDRVNHSAAALAFDTYQLCHEPRLAERIPELSPMTGIVQISDAKRPPESAAERCNPCEGTIPLGEIVRAFQRSGYDGYYDVQVWSSAGWSGDYSATSVQCREAVLKMVEEPHTLNR